MKPVINRRKFLQYGMAGAAALGSGMVGIERVYQADAEIDKVRLGATGLTVPRVAWGTGTNGSRRSSSQTRKGDDAFMKVARHVYDRGMKFYDMADLYGSHQLIGGLLKEVPREDVILLSKMWTTRTNWLEIETPRETINRFLRECDTDYLDIVLLHCLVNGNWQEEKREFIDSLSKAKQDGIVKAVGVSCHNWDAMKVACEDPWVDVILARINPFSSHMDGSPEAVMGILETARKNGKGVMGMKIFGNGDNITDAERDRSLRFALGSPDIHCITLGFESVSEVDDAVKRISRIV
jgi:1-deoxyxylulose-5-phosphate synthase